MEMENERETNWEVQLLGYFGTKNEKSLLFVEFGHGFNQLLEKDRRRKKQRKRRMKI
jgi:hypothetical protein